eukprot:403355665
MATPLQDSTLDLKSNLIQPYITPNAQVSKNVFIEDLEQVNIQQQKELQLQLEHLNPDQTGQNIANFESSDKILGLSHSRNTLNNPLRLHDLKVKTHNIHEGQTSGSGQIEQNQYEETRKSNNIENMQSETTRSRSNLRQSDA